jgi:Secretion system C-terminal sorting domain
MKRLYLLILSALLTTVGWGQNFTEDFNYSTGSLLSANGWTIINSSGTTNPLTVNNTGLSYPGSPSSGVGFGVNMTTSGQDVGRFLTAISSGSVYMSFFVNVSAAGTGDNCFGIMNGTSPMPGIAARGYIRSSGAGFNFGISKTTVTTGTYESTVRSFNTTYLVVIKYTFNTGSTTDDIVSLYVNPILGDIEPVTPLLSVGSGTNDPTTGLVGPCIVQRTAATAPTLQIDGIRVGATWAFVTPSNVSLSVTPSSLNFGTVPAGAPTSSLTFNLSGSNLSPAPGNITVTAPSAEFQVSNDNSTWGPSTTIANTSATLAATPVYVRFSPTVTGPVTGNITLSGGGVVIPPVVAVSGIGGTPFYSKPAGSLTNLATWGAATNGTGAAPADFVSDYQIFIVSNRTTTTLDADWQIFGVGSKIVVGNGTAATTLILPADFTIINPVDNKVDVNNNSTVEVANKLYRGGVSDPAKIPFPYFGTTALSSTVEYSWNGTSTSDTVRIPTEIFGNLKLTNGLKYFSSGFVFVNGNLDIADVVGVNGTGTSASVLVRGNVALNSSFFDTDPSSDATRISLNLGGSGTQTISGGDFYVNQIRTQAISSSVPASTIDIVLAPNTNVFTGFVSGASSGGGINLQQPTHNLSLNGNTLTMGNGSSFLSTNQGTISGSATSNIIINKTSGSVAIGSVSFRAGGQVLNNFSYNSTGSGSNNLTLNSPLTVNGSLSFNSGKILLGSNTLTVAGTISGASSASHVVTNGAGALKINGVGAGTVTFPVAPSVTLYHPATISNSGTTDNFSVNVASAAPSCGDATSSVTATWNITEETAGGSNCTISLDYTGAATGGAYTAVAARVVDCGGSGPYYSNGSVTGTIATGTGFTSFSPFGITSNIAILPVTFINFSGSRIGNRNKLSWTTGSEQNNLGFEVQRSLDGQNYDNIGFVNTLAPGGSVRNLTYNFTDSNVTAGKVLYYRLRQVDINNQSRYSVIVKIKGEQAPKLTIDAIAPNPVQSSFTASISSPIKNLVNVQVQDLMGRILLQQQVSIMPGTNVIPVNVSSLHNGVYVLKVVSNDKNQVPAIKFIKQ